MMEMQHNVLSLTNNPGPYNQLVIKVNPQICKMMKNAVMNQANKIGYKFQKRNQNGTKNSFTMETILSI